MSIRYSLESAPAARVDGSGHIDHDIRAMEDSSGDWVAVPGYHKTISVPAADAAAIMAMPHGNASQRQAKNQAYKDLLIDNRNSLPTPLRPPDADDWSKAGIEQYLIDYAAWNDEFTSINGETDTAAADVDDYIVNVLGQSYPVGFSL